MAFMPAATAEFLYTVPKINYCLSDIRYEVGANYLKLSDAEFLLISPKNA